MNKTLSRKISDRTDYGSINVAIADRMPRDLDRTIIVYDVPADAELAMLTAGATVISADA